MAPRPFLLGGLVLGSLALAGTAAAALTLTIGALENLGLPAANVYDGSALTSGVNSSGTVVGAVDIGSRNNTRPVRSQNGGVPVLLPMPAGSVDANGYGVGWALGVAENGLTVGVATRTVDGVSYLSAVLWDADGATTVLPDGAPFPSGGGSYSAATAVSPSGKYVVGRSYFGPGDPRYGLGLAGARWTVGGGGPLPLQSLGQYGGALAVNDAGVAVGYEWKAGGGWTAARWAADGSVTWLPHLVPTGATAPTYRLDAASAILPDGTIFGSQTIDPDGPGPAQERDYAVRWNTDGTVTDLSPAGALSAGIAAANETGLLIAYACYPDPNHPGSLAYAACGPGALFNGVFTALPNADAVANGLSRAVNGVAYAAATPWAPNGIGRWKLTVSSASNAAPTVSFPTVTVNATEGSAVTVTATATDPDGPAPITYAWDLSDGTAHTRSTGTSSSYTFTPPDNGSYVVTVTATDGAGATSTAASVTVKVSNVAPKVTALSVPNGPVATGATVTATATYTDPGSDTHTAQFTWDWDPVAGAPAAGAAVTTAAGAFTAAATGQATSTTMYAAPGVYTVRVAVTDDDGGTGTRTSGSDVPAYVVVYDPSAGFVTGGGWVLSGAGDCTLTDTCKAASGRASFGFVSKYQKGATQPTGTTEFDFKAAGFYFASEAYQWLVVSGPQAQFKGTGSVNGQTGYGFLVTAVDGQLVGGVDKFRIKVWSLATGDVIYDNQRGQPDDSGSATAIGGGNIVIH